MILRQDLLTSASPAGLQVYQLTSEGVPSSHLYMEAQVFSPDSKRLLVHRSAHAHGSDKHDPEHQYLVCDLDSGGAFLALTTEVGATAPSVSPDGKWVYYFVNETEVGGGRLTLRRVRMDATERETLLVIDAPIAGTDLRPSHIYPLSTIRSDGDSLALSCFLRDGERDDLPWGLMVFDLRAATVRVVLQGNDWINIHPQYSRSLDPVAKHDILVQQNHGYFHDPGDGAWRFSHNSTGADIHVIRDDGSNFRNMPWGRDGNEFCQGHQCWIGRSTRAITSTGTRRPAEQQIIAGRAAPYAGHVGLATPGGWRNDMTRSFASPHFHHFATDIAGRTFISDWRFEERQAIYLAHFPNDDEAPLEGFTYLCDPRSSWKKESHVHPFLSPDGSHGFFNSDESGTLQAYMVCGW